jgi:hypothetical protein
MLTDNLTCEIWHNFYSGPDHEYVLILEAHREGFWQWFQSEADIYTELVQPENAINNKFLSSRCIGNSQVAANDLEIEYLEGFASRGDRFIFHGFNVVNNAVVDVTTQNNPENFIEHFGGLPNLYVGVKISTNYMQQMNGQAIAENRINIAPLLYKYYLQQINT